MALRAASTEPRRVVGVDWWLFSGSQGLYDLEGIGGPDALEVATYEELVNAGGVTRYWLWLTNIPVKDVDRVAPLLDVLNVGFLVAGAKEAPPGSSTFRRSCRTDARSDDGTSAWPRRSSSTMCAPTAMSMTSCAKPRRRSAVPAVQSSDAEAIEMTRAIAAPSGAVIQAHDYEMTVRHITIHDRRATSRFLRFR